jgi:hypothetical protein
LRLSFSLGLLYLQRSSLACFPTPVYVNPRSRTFVPFRLSKMSSVFGHNPTHYDVSTTGSMQESNLLRLKALQGGRATLMVFDRISCPVLKVPLADDTRQLETQPIPLSPWLVHGLPRTPRMSIWISTATLATTTVLPTTVLTTIQSTITA